MNIAIGVLSVLLIVIGVAYFAVDLYVKESPVKSEKKRVLKTKKRLNYQGDTSLKIPEGFKVMPDGQIVLVKK